MSPILTSTILGTLHSDMSQYLEELKNEIKLQQELMSGQDMADEQENPD